MMFNSTVNNHNTVNWRNDLSGISDHDDDSDNELPLSSILDFGHPIGNNKIIKSRVQKCNFVDYQTKPKIEQDNKLSQPSIPDLVHSISNHKKIKYKFKEYETVDHQIELDINQDYELPLSSIADFLRPIDRKLQSSELQKCGTVDYQTEENNNKDDKFTLSSIAHFVDHSWIDKKFIKREAVYCQSKENINHYNKSKPNRLICNKEQSSIIMDNPSKEYKCDICSKIFSKRTDIIKHFKTSLCFPDIVYIFDGF